MVKEQHPRKGTDNGQASTHDDAIQTAYGRSHMQTQQALILDTTHIGSPTQKESYCHICHGMHLGPPFLPS